jgi:hypothetical protein
VDDFVRLVKVINPYIQRGPYASFSEDLLKLDDTFFELFESMDALEDVQQYVYQADEGTVSDEARGKGIVVRDVLGLNKCSKALKTLDQKGAFLDHVDIFLDEMGEIIATKKIPAKMVREITIRPLVNVHNVLARRDFPEFETWKGQFLTLLQTVRKKIIYLQGVNVRFIEGVVLHSTKQVSLEKKRLGQKSLKQFKRGWRQKSKNRKKKIL